MWLAAHLFFLSGASVLNDRTVPIANLLPSVLLFAVCYFLLNSWLMAAAVSLGGQLRALAIWRDNFLWVCLSFLGGASRAILLVSISKEVNLTTLAVVIPLLVISYLTSHTSLARVEDANRHIEELNTLYLSTVETLHGD